MEKLTERQKDSRFTYSLILIAPGCQLPWTKCCILVKKNIHQLLDQRAIGSESKGNRKKKATWPLIYLNYAYCKSDIRYVVFTFRNDVTENTCSLTVKSNFCRTCGSCQYRVDIKLTRKWIKFPICSIWTHP